MMVVKGQKIHSVSPNTGHQNPIGKYAKLV